MARPWPFSFGMFGSQNPALASSTDLIGAMPTGGADAIASRGEATEEDELLDRAAMESGTD